MKSIIFAVLCFFAVVGNASANGYCEGRGSQAAVNSCYMVQIKTQATTIQAAYDRFMASTILTQKQKDLLTKNQEQWKVSMTEQCQESLPCYEATAKARYMDLNMEYNRIHGVAAANRVASK